MRIAIYWFRQDLRLDDNPALCAACAAADALLPVYVLPPDEDTQWGVKRLGQHRKYVLADTLKELDAGLRRRGSRLLLLDGDAAACLGELARALGATVYCAALAAPEEAQQLAHLQAAGVRVLAGWQDTLYTESQLPFALADLPLVFTRFRQQLQAAALSPVPPLPAPAALPPWPDGVAPGRALPADWLMPPPPDARSSFPYARADWRGGEQAAQARVQRWLATHGASYKRTRNGLMGPDYASKWSPWLAQGSLSVRRAARLLAQHEGEQGVSEGSDWLWFELLWREYFRWLMRRFGRQLFLRHGLQPPCPAPGHDAEAFARWRRGETGEPWIDAGMRELAATGFLSNRMRQNVASYLIHDLGCDWRAGAAWFESCLIDYDVASNQGNWLYLAGCGTDPRGSRRFNPARQAAEYDPDGAYRALWSTP